MLLQQFVCAVLLDFLPTSLSCFPDSLNLQPPGVGGGGGVMAIAPDTGGCLRASGRPFSKKTSSWGNNIISLRSR